MTYQEIKSKYLWKTVDITSHGDDFGTCLVYMTYVLQSGNVGLLFTSHEGHGSDGDIFFKVDPYNDYTLLDSAGLAVVESTKLYHEAIERLFDGYDSQTFVDSFVTDITKRDFQWN
jgi:hypothetical protein